MRGIAATTDETVRAQFVAAMGNTATGVTVVASDGAAGRYAQTVSAMCSVSADPPSLLVSVHHGSPLTGALRKNRVFSVNVLSVDQAHVSDTFAGRPSAGRPYDFGCAAWTELRTGAPTLRDAAATFDCALVEAVEAGTHQLLIGAVVDTDTAHIEPLVYRARQYGRYSPLSARGLTSADEEHTRIRGGAM